MMMLRKILKGLLGLMLVGLAVACAFLTLRPPSILIVGTAYAAKIVCSSVFVAGRDEGDVFKTDVQAPGSPIMRAFKVNVDHERKRVSVTFLGFVGRSVAVYRDGLGCASVENGDADRVQAATLAGSGPLPVDAALPWPQGEGATLLPKLDAILGSSDLTGPGMRGVVVVQHGRIVAEAYGEGFTKDTRLLGWSMTKTVTAGLVGRMMAEGHLQFDQKALMAGWSGDTRKDIALSDLLGMQSGLEFEEAYGDVNDTTRMLFLEPDMAGFVAAKPAQSPAGTVFNYSTGTSVLISRIWMDHLASHDEALAYPRKALFGPLGMASAVMEADASGTFVGGSYLYATARDWARYGQFLLQDGVWNGVRLLPEGYVTHMRTGTPASGYSYSEAQSWIAGPGDVWNASEGLPEDTFWLRGHDGQSVAIIPSLDMVVVRMGLTPSSLDYKPQPMIKALIASLGQ
jgi:CubicO group peptidase (beta-lactamase class C family)